MRRILITAILVLFAAAGVAYAQDPVKVDPKHYKVEFENAQVRVLRISYGAHEKSVMHEHHPGTAIFLTDQSIKFTFPDGSSEVVPGKAGETVWIPGGKHNPENLSDKPMEAVLVEEKTMPIPAAPMKLQTPSKKSSTKAPAKKSNP